MLILKWEQRLNYTVHITFTFVVVEVRTKILSQLQSSLEYVNQPNANMYIKKQIGRVALLYALCVNECSK